MAQEDDDQKGHGQEHGRKIAEVLSRLDGANQTIVEEQLKHLSEQVPPALLSSIAVGCLVVYVLMDWVDMGLLLAWLAVLILSVVIRILVIMPVVHEKSLDKTFPWKQHLVLLVATLVSGLIWGVGGLLFFDPTNVTSFALIVIVLSGVTAGAIAPYSSYTPAYFCFAAPTMLPLSFRCLWEGDPFISMVGTMMLIFFLVTLISSRNYERTFIKSIKLQFENNDLLQELAVANQKLHEYSYTDPLTGIANRRAFDERLQAEWELISEKGGMLSLILLDVDHFKDYNDQFGHDMGDEVLTAIAENLQQQCNSLPCEAFRVGGEEFAVLMPDMNSDQVIALAEKVRMAAESLHRSGSGAKFQSEITVSIGVTTFTSPVDQHISAIYRKADQALYRAKKEGRNRVVLDK